MKPLSIIMLLPALAWLLAGCAGGRDRVEIAESPYDPPWPISAVTLLSTTL